MNRGTEIPVCDRNSVIGRNRDTGSYTRYNLIWNFMFAQKFQFFSATSKKERITTFEADNTISLQGFLQKHLIDSFLWHRMFICTFSYIY